MADQSPNPQRDDEFVCPARGVLVAIGITAILGLLIEIVIEWIRSPWPL